LTADFSRFSASHFKVEVTTSYNPRANIPACSVISIRIIFFLLFDIKENPDPEIDVKLPN